MRCNKGLGRKNARELRLQLEQEKAELKAQRVAPYFTKLAAKREADPNFRKSGDSKVIVSNAEINEMIRTFYGNKQPTARVRRKLANDLRARRNYFASESEA